MRQVPEYVLRATLEQVDEARSWLVDINAPEHKDLKDATPAGVLYKIERAREILDEVGDVLDAYDVERSPRGEPVIRTETTEPESHGG